MRPVMVLSFVLALLAATVIAGCSGDDDGDPREPTGVPPEIRIGIVQSLSGAASIYGRSVVNGIELAMLQFNAEDGDLRMTMLLQDDASTTEGGEVAFRTVLDAGVTAVIGPTLSNVALAALPLAQDAGVPVLGATLTAQGITEIGDYVFRVALTEAVVVPATIERVHGEAPISTAVLVFDGSDAFSRSSADAMRAGIATIGATILGEVDVSQEDIEDALEGLGPEAPDAFLITPLVDQSAPIVEAVRASGFEGTIIGGNSFNTLAISGAAGAAVEGAYAGAAWNPAADREASRRFVEAYTEQYGMAPDLFAAQGYSAVHVLHDALKRAGSTEGPAVRDALASTSDVETPLGSLSFSERRDALHEPVVQRFEGGKLALVD